MNGVTGNQVVREFRLTEANDGGFGVENLMSRPGVEERKRSSPIEEHRQIVRVIQVLRSNFPHQVRSVLVVLWLDKSSLTRDVTAEQQSPEQARVDVLLLENV